MDLAGTDLTGADLTDANLANSLLVEVTFIDANLKSANFSGANLLRADFTGARNLTVDQLKSITRLEGCTLPDKTRLPQRIEMGDPEPDWQTQLNDWCEHQA